MGGGVSRPMDPPRFERSHYSVYREEDAPHWICDIRDVRPINFASAGLASEAGCPPRTMVQVFDSLIKNHNGNCSAMRVERPVPPLDANGKAPPPMNPADLTVFSYAQYYEEAKAVAAGLVAVGFAPKDCVCVFGFNCPEWMFAAVSAMFAGGCFTGIYPTDTPEQVNWKAKLSNSSVAFAENEAAAQRFLETADDMPYLKAIVHWNKDFKKGTSPHKRSDGSEILLKSWDEIKTAGESMVAEVEKRMADVKPTDCADIIYTSGTTGNPKGVMISHDNIVYETECMLKAFEGYLDINKEHRSLSYLPLSHIAGSLVDIFLPIFVTEKSARGCCDTVTFARPYDLKAGSLADRLRLTRPTIFMGVPRVWEKVHEKMLVLGKKTKGLKLKVIKYCKGKALKYAEGQQLGQSGNIPFGYQTSKKLILSKIKEKLGLDQCELGYTGAAPMKIDTARFFGSLGITINDVYGMSETTGVCTLSTPKTILWGTVGFPLPGVEVEIFKVNPDDVNDKKMCPRADDVFNPKPENEGEICFRGRNIMLGYLANPSFGPEHVEEMKKKNSATIDKEGWLHSGDKGCKSHSDMIRICGRYKELIIGAGGENIAPVPIEDNILRLMPGISNIMMIGDQRKYNTALITLRAEGATGEMPGTNKLDPDVFDISPGITTIPQACSDPVWIQKITDAIKATNEDGKVCPSNAAKIQKFTIYPQGDFSVITGDLTPTLKLKRSVVEKKHKEMIDQMYESQDVYVKYQV